MTDTDSLREQIAHALRGATDDGADRTEDHADAVLAVVQPAIREAQAEAWGEGHEIGWLNADECWRCDGSIPAYYKAYTTPNPYRDERSADA